MLDHDIPDIDADAEFNAAVARASIARGHIVLPLVGTAQAVDDAAELDQQPVAGGFDDPPAVFGDFWIDQFGPQQAQLIERPLLVRSDQPRIAHYIGS